MGSSHLKGPTIVTFATIKYKRNRRFCADSDDGNTSDRICEWWKMQTTRDFVIDEIMWVREFYDLLLTPMFTVDVMVCGHVWTHIFERDLCLFVSNWGWFNFSLCRRRWCCCCCLHWLCFGHMCPMFTHQNWFFFWAHFMRKTMNFKCLSMFVAFFCI